MRVNFFDSIIIPTPGDKIYSRLGYAKGITKLKDKQRYKIEQCIEEALSFVRLKGAGARIRVTERDYSKVVLSTGDIFKSKELAKLLDACQEVLLMGVTAGSEIVKSIQENFFGRDETKAVIFDAVASEIVDAGLNWIMGYFDRELCRENKQLTKQRFSAGYGDFLLDNQKTICDTLGLEKIGVSLLDSYMLIPEKSVTAVAGVKLTEKG